MANIQFNTKNGKDFREIMAKYNDAQHGLNDYILSKSDRVKSLNTLIATNKDELSRIEKGDKSVLRAKSVIESEIKDFESKLDAESKALADARKECAKRLEDAEKLVTEKLYKSAMTDTFYTEFASWLVAQGFADATIDNAPTLYFGEKKNSARGSFNDENHKLVGKMSFKPWRTLFLCKLCDVLVENKAISPYKYNYVKPTKNK